MKTRQKLQLIDVSDDVMLPIYLIREELKSRKLFNTLQAVGIQDCYFQPHLDSLILRSMGIDECGDETFDRYVDIIEKRSRKITMERGSVMKQAVKVYRELFRLKKRLGRKRIGSAIAHDRRMKLSDAVTVSEQITNGGRGDQETGAGHSNSQRE